MEVDSISHGIIFIPLSNRLSTVTDAVASIEFRKDINQSINLQALPVVTLSENGSLGKSESKIEAMPSEGLVSMEPVEVSVSMLESQKESSPKTRPTNTPDKTKGCPIPTCSRYQRAFSRAHDLKRHIARHQAKLHRNSEPQPSDVRTCDQCGDHFLNDLILQRHINTTHSSKSPRSNNNPTTNNNNNNNNNKNNNNKNNNNNNNNNNSDTDDYSCNICELKFKNFEQLNSHAVIHKKSSENKFPSEESLSNHLKHHSQEITSSLDLEPEEKIDDFLLEELLLLKNPRVPTEPCNKNQNEKSPAEKDKSKIQCGYCAKTFKTQWTLNTHVAAHEGRYQFACSICSKKFVRKSHFSSHLRSHEATRPFVCDYCGKAFKELKHRREHVKRTHNSNNNNNNNSNDNNNNRNAIQNLLDSISASVTAEDSIICDQPKLTLLMPMNFST
ncbi:zinc finger protein 530-like isoform X1 [Cotesia glomerata]|uniref:C2H2-type domain-containing protein n=1 Tax=Cotesia glomerata TaxID=32391 RepID=A0AAV7IY83_COTGL|nr:zinc finger protein 530-like isoform X1 [Cotesia glomerata]XP_044584383.1 zinc finger protein 530-like isoform X1 [Cotesia glomerata]KAH0560779.1 hypothetical protein KQX54_008274 [Cotesia glomerata]